MLEDIKAVIFDLDGSLVDSMWVWESIDHMFIGEYELTVPKDFYKKMEGKGFTETAQYFLESFPELDFTVDEIKEEWTRLAIDKYKKEVPLKEGAYEFLRSLHEKNIPVGIATSNSRELVETVVEARNISQFIKVICTSCEVKAGKPSPDVYLKAASQLEVDPKNCFVFEDVPMGILAGKNAGMTVCAVEDEFSKDQREKKRELADYYIQNYNDIKNRTYEVT